MARRSTLLLTLTSPFALSLATPASRKRRFRIARPRPMTSPSAPHSEPSSSGDDDGHDADDQGRQDRPAQHLGQRVALEVRQTLEQVHGGDLYRYVRICLMTLKAAVDQARAGGRPAGNAGAVWKTCPATARGPRPAPTLIAAERPMPRKARPRAGVRLLAAVETSVLRGAHLTDGRAGRGSPDIRMRLLPPYAERGAPESIVPIPAGSTGRGEVDGVHRRHHRIPARFASKRSRGEPDHLRGPASTCPLELGMLLVGGLVLLLPLPRRRPGWKNV